MSEQLKAKLASMGYKSLGQKPTKEGTARRSRRRTAVTLGRMADRNLAGRLKAMGFVVL